MTGTIQVVRVQDCIDYLGCLVKDGVLYHHNRVGDVIELTEEREDGELDASSGDRRWVSKWGVKR